MQGQKPEILEMKVVVGDRYQKQREDLPLYVLQPRPFLPGFIIDQHRREERRREERQDDERPRVSIYEVPYFPENLERDYKSNKVPTDRGVTIIEMYRN